MKIRPVTLCIAAFGAILFFGGGFLTGRLWQPVLEDKNTTVAVGKRPRPIAKLPPVSPENRAAERDPWKDDGENATSPDRVEKLEKRVARLLTQIESLRDLADDQLIAAVRALDIAESSFAALYSAYVDETAQLENASRGGWGQRHPKILALNASLDTKYAQLLEASESVKRGLDEKLNAAQKKLETERTELKVQHTKDRVRQAKNEGAPGKYDGPPPR
jgi:hypothetical protein